MIKDHTARDKQLIRDFGGEPQEQFGPDGLINGAPVEVRQARVETRFRINEDTHEDLMDNGGSYIFDKLGDNKPPKHVEAEEVDQELSEDYHSDRGYKHQFITVEDIL